MEATAFPPVHREIPDERLFPGTAPEQFAGIGDESEGGTVSFPGAITVPGDGDYSFRAKLSDDAKTLSLTCLRNGLAVIVK